jgi:hypothetical protein
LRRNDKGTLVISFGGLVLIVVFLMDLHR